MQPVKQWPVHPDTEWPAIPVEVVERDYKVYKDLSSNPNETIKFYEIKPFTHYIFIHRKGSQVATMVHAQNILVFLLKHL